MADQENQNQNQDPLLDTVQPNINDKIMKASNFLSRHSLPNLNFSIALILIFGIPIISQIANDPHAGIVGVGGSFLFFLMMIFSILGMYGQEKKQDWAYTIYRDSTIILSVGFLCLFIVSLITIITGDYDLFLAKTTTIIFLIISLPYALWLGVSFLYARDALRKIRTGSVSVDQQQQQQEQEQY